MNDFELLGKIFYYFQNFNNISDGYFTDEDIAKLSKFNVNYSFKDNQDAYNNFIGWCNYYFDIKRMHVYSFLARLSLLNHDYYYENKVLLDTIVPFKFDDLIFLKYVVEGSINSSDYSKYSDYFSYIQSFIDSGFDNSYGRTCDLELLRNTLGKYYDSQHIHDRINYSYIFRKPLSDILNKSDEEIESLFNSCIINKTNFGEAQKIMGAFAEQKSFNLLKSKSIIWVSKYNGDGYGFDMILPKASLAGNFRGKLYEIKSTTMFKNKITEILTPNEGDVFKNTLKEDSFYDYIIHVYDVKFDNDKFAPMPEPLILFYDRNNFEVYDNHDIPYKIIENSNGRVGFQDKLEKYKHLFYIKT